MLGRSGQIAQELARLGRERHLEMVVAGRETIDLSDVPDIGPMLDQIRPRAVINAAAYTAVDRAETDRDAAFRLNRDAPARLAAACASRELPFVHFSTDYVFDGRKRRPYVESDLIAPINVYGASKAEGEAEVLGAGGRSVILRTSWVFGAFGVNFMKTMLSLARSRQEVSVVADQIGRPTWSRDAAIAALESVEMLSSGGGSGLFHAAGADDASWADLAEVFFERLGETGEAAATVRRIATEDYPTAARRSAYSSLDSSRLAAACAWRPSPWRQAALAAFNDLQTQNRKINA